MLRRIVPNARLLKTRAFGDVLFGCPAELIKALLKRQVLPSTYVLTLRTMRSGHSMMDIEFLLYATMFSVEKRGKLHLVCTEPQRRRLLTVLKESLFCPSVRNLARSMMPEDALRVRVGRVLGRGMLRHVRSAEWNLALDSLADRLEACPELYKAFDKAMKEHLSAGEIAERVLPFFKGHPELRRGKERAAARVTVDGAIIKRESRWFLPEEGEPDEILARHVRFSVFDRKGVVHIRKDGRRLTISQPEACLFRAREGGGRSVEVDLRAVERPAGSSAQRKTPFQAPRLGVTFIGAGTGFSTDQHTTCCVAWLGGRGICIDALADAPRRLRRQGISLRDVRHIILTHIHGDHDAGLMQLIMDGEKRCLMTSRVIFDSFIRKAEAVTCIPRDELKGLVDFVELRPGEEVPVPGIPRARVLFEYSFHSIPTGRIVLSWNEPGRRRRKLFFSGDTSYSPQILQDAFEKGFLAPERRGSLLGFGWGAELIVHEAGGETIHTDAADLAGLPAQVRRRIWLNHYHGRPRKPFKLMRFARERETVALLGPARSGAPARRLAALRSSPLFDRHSRGRLVKMLAEGRVRRFRAGSVIVKEGSLGKDFYFVMEGLAQVEKGGRPVNICERGDSFGELAVLSRDGRRHATVRAKTDMELLILDAGLYRRFGLPEAVEKNLYDLVDFFSDHSSSALMSSLALGRIVSFPPGEDIIRVGDSDRSVFILLRGSVDILDAGQKRITTLSAVDIFGEIAALEGIRRTSTVRAESAVRTLELDEEEFRRIVQRFPSFYATVSQKERKRLSSPQTLQQVFQNEFARR